MSAAAAAADNVQCNSEKTESNAKVRSLNVAHSQQSNLHFSPLSFCVSFFSFFCSKWLAFKKAV
jgi:hypothetical protein